MAGAAAHGRHASVRTGEWWLARFFPIWSRNRYVHLVHTQPVAVSAKL